MADHDTERKAEHDLQAAIYLNEGDKTESFDTPTPQERLSHSVRFAGMKNVPIQMATHKLRIDRNEREVKAVQVETNDLRDVVYSMTDRIDRMLNMMDNRFKGELRALRRDEALEREKLRRLISRLEVEVLVVLEALLALLAALCCALCTVSGMGFGMRFD